MEKPGVLQFMGSGRVGHGLMIEQQQRDGSKDGCNEFSNGGSGFEDSRSYKDFGQCKNQS